MKIETLYEHFLKSTGICTDTRKITKGCLFFALKGDNFNGNTFAQQALDKGAYRVVIDEINYHKNTGETILYGNSLKLLQKLAAYHRKMLNIPIIGLTGSNGKTTTKELINAVLSQQFNTSATLGNLNNHIGVPLTLLSMTSETEIGIVEMGANHLEEIAALSNIAQPNFGYITNFGKAHLEGFGGLEGVVKGKSELYHYIKEHNGTVFVNGNDSKQFGITERMPRYTFGNSSSDCEVTLIDSTDKLLVQYKGEQIQTQLIGAYNFSNISAAIAMGDFFELPLESIKKGLEAYIPSMNRSQVLHKNSNQIIMDAYNANPTSMLAALQNFQQAEGNNKLMILGDMFELGPEANKEHQAITSFIETNPFGTAYLVGSLFSTSETSANHIQFFTNYEALENHMKVHVPEDAFILIKGSRGMALERVLSVL